MSPTATAERAISELEEAVGADEMPASLEIDAHHLATRRREFVEWMRSANAGRVVLASAERR